MKFHNRHYANIGQIFSTGGRRRHPGQYYTPTATKSVWSFNNHVDFEMTRLPSMKHERFRHGCGIVYSHHHGGRPLLVVAGSYYKKGRNKSEYLDFTLPGSKWQLCSKLSNFLKLSNCQFFDTVVDH